MMQDMIEREIFIRAGIDRVWSLVANTGFWVGEDLHFDHEAREGETVVFDAGRHGRFPVRVDRLEPPRYAAYRWASGFPGAGLTEANTTLIEFTLVEQHGGVLLRLKESGFSGLAATLDFRDARRDHNDKAWAVQLERLQRAGESVPVP